jgi:DNA-binding PadR family transcriptional regulator
MRRWQLPVFTYIYDHKTVEANLPRAISPDDVVNHWAKEDLLMSRAREIDEKEEQLPLTPAMFHVLLALADGERHGYAILKEVERRTGGRVRLSAGTLYGIIKRLNSEGWIVESSKRPAAGLDDERRRYYRLTDVGRQVAVTEARRLEELLEMARNKNLFSKPKLA